MSHSRLEGVTNKSRWVERASLRHAVISSSKHGNEARFVADLAPCFIVERTTALRSLLVTALPRLSQPLPILLGRILGGISLSSIVMRRVFDVGGI